MNKFLLRPLSLVLLLSQFILIKIGELPFWLISRTLALASKRVRLPAEAFRWHRGRGRPPKLWNKIPQKIKIITSIAVLALIFFLYTNFVFMAAYQLPNPDRLTSPTQPLTTEIYDRKGQLLYRLYEDRNRSLIKFEDLPKYLIHATIAIEDKNFYQHLGVDSSAIIRAIYHNITQKNLQGASTITQQLIKNTLLTTEQTYQRKIKEIFLAFWAERIYSKDQILKMYFNEAPFGGTAWGVEAASQTYFGKTTRDLNLAESAYLAGLPASPTQFSPFTASFQVAKTRQKEVLSKMVEAGFIDKLQAHEATDKPLNLLPQKNSILAPHFVMYVKDLLSQKFGPRVVSQGGLKITTTLDLNLQQNLEKIVKEEVEKLTELNVQNGAILVTDPKSGQILAMVGSKDYYQESFGNFNVTTALRQPGSSIKPATYAAAFEAGYSPGNTILDAPVNFIQPGSKPYSPLNYDGIFHGPVSIRVALGSSYNVPAVKMLSTVGIPRMIATAKSLGITTFDPPTGGPQRFGLSLTLGGGEVKMIDMMALYGTFSQMGRFNRPTPILKVTDSNGNVLEEYSNQSIQALQPEIAYLVTHILSDNKARTPAFGANSQLFIADHQVAVKTGTSDNKRDNWTFGYTPSFVVGVWVGNNDNSPMNPTLTSGVTGAAPIWNRIMKQLLANHPFLGFVRPAGIVEAQIDGRQDLTLSRNIPKSLVRIRKDGDNFHYSDAFSTFATSSAESNSARTFDSTN